jgi:hypothetical protein
MKASSEGKKALKTIAQNESVAEKYKLNRAGSDGNLGGMFYWIGICVIGQE